MSKSFKAGRALFEQLIDRPIAFHPCLVRISESLASGVLLSQLLYWSKVMGGKRFYKTDKELKVETGLTRHELINAKSRLIKLGIIVTELKRHPATTHYTLNEDFIIKKISELPIQMSEKRTTEGPECGQLDVRNPDNIHTETTQENNILSGKPDLTREIIQDLNQKSGRNFKHNTKATQRLINARIKEKFTVEDFKTVHDNKIPSWINDQEMRKYIRPETLYAASHFESYLNEKRTGAKEHTPYETEEGKKAREERRNRINTKLDREFGVAV